MNEATPTEILEALAAKVQQQNEEGVRQSLSS